MIFFVPRSITYLFAFGITIMAYLRARRFYQNIPESILEANNLDSKNLLVYPAAQLILYLPTILSTSKWVIGNSQGDMSGWSIVGIAFSGLRGFIYCMIFRRHFPQIKEGCESTRNQSKSPSLLYDM